MGVVDLDEAKIDAASTPAAPGALARLQRSEVASHHVANLSVNIPHENDGFRGGAEHLDELLACSASLPPTGFQLKVARDPIGAVLISQWRSLATAMRWLHHGATPMYQGWCKHRR